MNTKQKARHGSEWQHTMSQPLYQLAPVEGAIVLYVNFLRTINSLTNDS